MPANSFDYCFMPETKSNFDAMRPTPICADFNQCIGSHQTVHISTNCYYGYHDGRNASSATNTGETCEMMEVTDAHDAVCSNVGNLSQPQCNARKRGADDVHSPPPKKNRQDAQVQTEKRDPETTEKQRSEVEDEDLAIMFWNTHGGHLFHIIQCL